MIDARPLDAQVPAAARRQPLRRRKSERIHDVSTGDAAVEETGPMALHVRAGVKVAQHARNLREHFGVVRVGMQETEQFVQRFDLGGRAKVDAFEAAQQREPRLGTPGSVRASERGETGE
jgi:hypothetical protein